MVGVFLAKGFEEVEALTVVDILRRGGVDVETVSISKDKEVAGTHKINVQADTTIDAFDFDSCTMIVLPGGMPGTNNLNQCQKLREQIKAFDEAEKYVAAICAAPLVLGDLGLLEGKKCTIYPGMEDRLIGGKPKKDSVVQDGNIITSRGPGKAMTFALYLLETVKGKEVRDRIERNLVI